MSHQQQLRPTLPLPQPYVTSKKKRRQNPVDHIDQGEDHEMSRIGRRHRMGSPQNPSNLGGVQQASRRIPVPVHSWYLHRNRFPNYPISLPLLPDISKKETFSPPLGRLSYDTCDVGLLPLAFSEMSTAERLLKTSKKKTMKESPTKLWSLREK